MNSRSFSHYHLTKTEIDYYGIVVASQHYIRSLKIAMNYIALFYSYVSIENFSEELDSLFFRKLS